MLRASKDWLLLLVKATGALAVTAFAAFLVVTCGWYGILYMRAAIEQHVVFAMGAAVWWMLLLHSFVYAAAVIGIWPLLFRQRRH